MLDFSDRTRTGMFNVIWPLASSTLFFPFDDVLYVVKSSSCFYWRVSELKLPEILSLLFRNSRSRMVLYILSGVIKKTKSCWYATTLLVYYANSSIGNTAFWLFIKIKILFGIVVTLFIANSGVNKMLLNGVANYQSIQTDISYSFPTKSELLFSN